jgi:hypothetical protein
VQVWSSLGVGPRAAVEFAAVLPVAPPATRAVPAPPTEVGVSTRDQYVPTRDSDIVRPAPDQSPLRQPVRARSTIEEAANGAR